MAKTWRPQDERSKREPESRHSYDDDNDRKDDDEDERDGNEDDNAGDGDGDDIDAGIRKQNPGEGWSARSTSWSSDPISLSSGSWSAFLLIMMTYVAK